MLSREVARFRAATLRALRAFFDGRGYLEADVPTLAPALIPEAHIEVFATRVVSPFGEPDAPERFLIPSPEIWMKRLLAAGYGSHYCLGKAYRNAEQDSPQHRHEFTMLEWYTVEADYRSQMELTRELLTEVCARVADEAAYEPAACGALAAEPERLSVSEALERWAGAPADVFERDGALRRTAEARGLHVDPDERDEDLYQRLLLTFVEPALPRDRPVFLTDYPALVPTLARTNGTTAERWELYLAGMEVANCYTEERDRRGLERFLDAEGARKAHALVPHPPATTLLEFAQAPPCSGVALGVDRLIMAMLGIRDIRGVIFFP